MSRGFLSTAAAGRRLWLLACASTGCLLTGCSDGVRSPSSEKMAPFEANEATGPAVDMDRVLQAKIVTGPYRTGIGDIVQLEMPKILTSQTFDGTADDGRATYTCRIADDGTIMLPVAGPLVAAGKSLAEIEAGVLAQYYPKYIKAPFSVYASILQYNTRRVSIVGAVTRPGVYSLRPDQMSLVALLMEAGGIVERGAAVIRIARREAGGSPNPEQHVSAPLRSADSQPRIQPVQATFVEETAPAAGETFRAVFEREGPLKTTGWLAVAGPNETLIRKWCDLAGQCQMSAFIHAAAAASGQIPVADLQRKVARLAQAMEASPLSCETAAVAQDCGWTVEEGRLVTLLGAPPIKEQVPYSPSAAVRSVERVSDDKAVTALVLPVKGLNIPFRDVALQEGDSVTVEWLRERLISVLGLVRTPGNFPYPQNTQYNLIQAIGFAGGLDAVADPRYVSMYRLQPDGQIASVTYIELAVPLYTSTAKLYLDYGGIRISRPYTPGSAPQTDKYVYTQAEIAAREAESFRKGVQFLAEDPGALRQYMLVKAGVSVPQGAVTEKTSLENRLTELQAQRETLLDKLTPDHPSAAALALEIERVQARIAELDSRFVAAALEAAQQRHTEARDYAKQLRTVYNEQRKQVTQLNTEIAQYQRLRSEVDQLPGHSQTLEQQIRGIRKIVGEDVAQLKMEILEPALPAAEVSSRHKEKIIAMARAGQKTLILDADLRKSIQHRIFDIDYQEPCLCNVLEGKVKLMEAIQPTQVAGLARAPSSITATNRSSPISAPERPWARS